MQMDLVNKYKKNSNDTGSVELQVIAITNEINKLIEHFKVHKKDHSSKRGLTKLVSRRKNFLNYIKNNNESLYKQIVEDLGLRK